MRPWLIVSTACSFKSTPTTLNPLLANKAADKQLMGDAQEQITELGLLGAYQAQVP